MGRAGRGRGVGEGLDWGGKLEVGREEGGYEVRGDKGMYGHTEVSEWWWWKVLRDALYVGELQ